jgi:hypothetical protein
MNWKEYERKKVSHNVRKCAGIFLKGLRKRMKNVR